MLSINDLKLAQCYAPRLYFDRKEPFFPVRIGVTVLHGAGRSPSFKRDLVAADTVIEYAVYYDYDIQHMYDLEHVWIFIDKDGGILDAEASFHGKYLKSLLKDRSNLCGSRVGLYIQPGKHAFSPIPDLFQLLPNYVSCTQEEAGADGLIYGDFLDGRISTDESTNDRIRNYLQTHRFEPSLIYTEWEYAERTDLFISWEKLCNEIPFRIHRELERLKK